jgi:hypothetical protein
MSRTISKTLKRRLEAQAEEANFLGFQKHASHVFDNIPETRDDEEEYIYTAAELQEDVENMLWKIAIRVQDYYGKSADMKQVGYVVDSTAEELIESIRRSTGAPIVGPYEPLVPGEMKVDIDND